MFIVLFLFVLSTTTMHNGMDIVYCLWTLLSAAVLTKGLIWPYLQPHACQVLHWSTYILSYVTHCVIVRPSVQTGMQTKLPRTKLPRQNYPDLNTHDKITPDFITPTNLSRLFYTDYSTPTKLPRPHYPRLNYPRQNYTRLNYTRLNYPDSITLYTKKLPHNSLL